ncbi:SUN domain-containing protein 3 isoform X2 [Aethina tumida]|uniref:SUN domain-containing protein 3 isoform X2 n=1 Tax=Aethina tumida TaxID=116153 RepID=UPI002148326F|nr:SUN domain-containing protein 3 isoform X2 [Aethina tumida]
MRRESSFHSFEDGKSVYKPTHNYNTRLTAKLAVLGTTGHETVDSTDNLTPSPSPILQFENPSFTSSPPSPLFRKREGSESSCDSRELLHNPYKYDMSSLPDMPNMGWQDRSFCPGHRTSSHRFGALSRPFDIWSKYARHIIATFLAFIILPVVNSVFMSYFTMKADLEKLKADNQILRDKINNLEISINFIKHGTHNVRDMVKDEMRRLASDQTGRTDYALESTGGSIVSLLPGTENYNRPKNLFGLSLCEGQNGPRAIIQIGTAPGQCWAFKGGSGGVIIKLVGHVNIDTISLEHIPKFMSPTGEISTAPKDFVVSALRSVEDGQGSYLGQFMYDINGPSIQNFKVANSFPVEYLLFKVLSNQGSPEFTCVYRLRVHGKLATPSIN